MQSALEKIGVDTRVQSAIPMDAVCEPYIRRRALRHLEKGRVVIFAAGLGAPFFTTDTAAALRAAEMGCDALLKGTSVDGVYTADPKKEPDAERYEQLSYLEVLAQDLRVMDASAIALMRDNAIPIVVFSIRERGQSDARACRARASSPPSPTSVTTRPRGGARHGRRPRSPIWRSIASAWTSPSRP